MTKEEQKINDRQMVRRLLLSFLFFPAIAGSFLQLPYFIVRWIITGKDFPESLFEKLIKDLDYNTYTHKHK